MITPETLLAKIPRVTPKYLGLLEKVGIISVRDFLLYFPFRYDDFSQIVQISEEYIGQTVTIKGIVKKTKLARIFRRKMTITEVVIQDEFNTPLKAIWFNQHFILDTLKEGVLVRLSGKLELKGKFFTMTNPAWEKSSREATNTGILVPVYNETRGLTSKWIRWQLKPLLPLAKQVEDPIPFEIRKRLNLYDIQTALQQIHFPQNPEELLRAQKRFAFEEMFLVQLKTLQVKHAWEKNNSLEILFDEKLIKKFVSVLPFKLTDAQRKSTFEILKDLEKPKPMNRLLNGDVGSGKTVVAAIASLQAISADFQVAIMAPTEVLAKQHFESFCKLFENYQINIALLTNSYKLLDDNRVSRTNLLDKIETGKIDLVIGTHALIQRDVRFKNLALVIIDEQHRFGVAQRAALQQETMSIKDGVQKTIPHLLTMTATPIPRTLAIALFGSLELSILDEMPKNRKPIITKIIPSTGRKEIYNFIRKEISDGRQVFVIFPLIEESKALTEIKAATVEHEKLSKIFPEFNIGLLHGRLKPTEKEKVMQEFKEKELDILVSTSVVEVGIDIPNATVMIIEDADRFGLSQLHQFRGRVGRGEHQSYCFLFTGSDSSKTAGRLTALTESNDGFRIAEKDLALRGPGQFFGTLQSGIPDIAMENLSNIKLIKYSRAEAQNLLSLDPELKKHPATQDALLKFSEKIHLE
ncbi:MAG: ATP-dependent DNA helicase RecG [Parcubacteria group bacterium]|jgi:ATP-dependent DNA helicase RecG